MNEIHSNFKLKNLLLSSFQKLYNLKVGTWEKYVYCSFANKVLLLCVSSPADLFSETRFKNAEINNAIKWNNKNGLPPNQMQSWARHETALLDLHNKRTIFLEIIS